MKTKTLPLLAVLLGSVAFSAAQEGERPERPDRERRGPSPEQIKEFDKDNDGELNADERTAMREAMRARAEERRKEMLAKYDANKDGELDADERKVMNAAIQAEMLERFDANKDGELDEAERAEMRKVFPGRGPGAREGREGRPAGEGRLRRGPRPDGPAPEPAPAPEASETAPEAEAE